MAEPSPQPTPSAVTPLEQEVLDEYSRLLGNLNKVLLSRSCNAYFARPFLQYPG